jgi:hypothetical protein
MLEGKNTIQIDTEGRERVAREQAVNGKIAQLEKQCKPKNTVRYWRVPLAMVGSDVKKCWPKWKLQTK